MSEHTKAPWQVRVSNIVSVGVAEGGEHWQFSGIVQCLGPREVAEANARHIIKCVNYHNRLMEHLRDVIGVIDGDGGTFNIKGARALLSELSAHNGGGGE